MSKKNRKVFARYLEIWERTYMSLNSYNTDNNINNNNNCYYFRKPNMCLTLFYMLSMYYFLSGSKNPWSHHLPFIHKETEAEKLSHFTNLHSCQWECWDSSWLQNCTSCPDPQKGRFLPGHLQLLIYLSIPSRETENRDRGVIRQ